MTENQLQSATRSHVDTRSHRHGATRASKSYVGTFAAREAMRLDGPMGASRRE
jgi:hypothetical protein